MESYPANFCGPNGYTHVPSSTQTDSSQSQACTDAQWEFGLSTAGCAVATAAAVGSGFLAAAGAALACTEAVRDGFDMVETCGY